ncbi:hypothetical protein T265_06047 [Opisthorchis viverrini]|uniref:Uncharacterized protein n=1 Tax=Opisthorchis viverrini TaxID=6198 RepID=A0A074ZHM4_OPIVI|nr:hypothetical protein T265_06047 [Opisthorchis viverrini]KER26763.1 hypothetical protein T265_06047 [Opisthorchis viverrini]
MAPWLEHGFTVWKDRGSNPTSASRLSLSRLGQPGSIPALVFPSGGWQLDIERVLQCLEREFADRKVRGSNPTSVSQLPLSRLGQLGSIPALVLPSGGIAVWHRKRATAEQFFSPKTTRQQTTGFAILLVHQLHRSFVISFSSNTRSVPKWHAIQRKHEGWDTVRLPKPGHGKSRGRGRVGTTDLSFPPFGPELNFLTHSTLVHDKETAIRFLQSRGVSHQQRLCNNGHRMALSTLWIQRLELTHKPSNL